jgi:ADP-dependent NAD(P)H-hydrate dehydratase / NAD(P)H-hydrate epimerase
VSAIERIDSAIGRLPLHGVAATRAREVAALATVAPYTLMARAGGAVARLALALAPHARRVLVFAGPGNNGGDGLEAATRLIGFGKRAQVVLVGAAERRGDAAQALARARAAGVEIRSLDSADDSGGDPPGLVIDALLGIGAARAAEGAMAAAIERIAALAARGARVLAIDVPSGLDADRGQPLGPHCVVAADTLTMLTLKPGLFTAAGRDHAGRAWLARLGGDCEGEGPVDAWLVGRGDPSCAPAARRHAQHKGSFGDVAVVGGANGMAGAAWLAARAGHAAGAGRVFVDILGDDAAAPSTRLDPRRPELMFRPGWWRGATEALASATVVCGCGGGDAVRAALPRLLSVVPRLVVDADALNAIAADTALATLTTARAARGLATIFTPHPLEAARLLGSSTAAVQGDRLRAARELAERFRTVVVVKGSGTVVAGAGDAPRINATGSAALASAGTGDVLAGWIGGRWASASAASAFDVATRAVIEHGAAAEPEAPGAIRAGDLIEALYRRSRGV